MFSLCPKGPHDFKIPLQGLKELLYIYITLRTFPFIWYVIPQLGSKMSNFLIYFMFKSLLWCWFPQKGAFYMFHKSSFSPKSLPSLKAFHFWIILVNTLELGGKFSDQLTSLFFSWSNFKERRLFFIIMLWHSDSRHLNFLIKIYFLINSSLILLAISLSWDSYKFNLSFN